LGKQHTTTKVITAGVIGVAGFMFAGPLQASAKTVTVKSGDTVWKLANRYGVSVSSIEKTNHLNKDMIFAGQKIVLGSSSASAKTTHTSAKQTTVKTPKSNTQVTTKANAATSPVKTTATASTYKVKSGDTLNKISAKYGITVNRLRSLNHLNGDTIYTGQRLKVKGTAAKAKTSATTTVKSVASSTNTKAATATTTKKQATNTTPKAKKTVKADAAGAPVTSVTSYAVKLASEKIPYVWGGSSLKGMDCSGFTSYVYAHTVGVSLPHNTVAQEAHVSTHSVSHAVPGDLLFWGSKGATYHVAIYIGNNQFVAAPEPGENVQIQSISSYFKPSFAGTVNG